MNILIKAGNHWHVEKFALKNIGVKFFFFVVFDHFLLLVDKFVVKTIGGHCGLTNKGFDIVNFGKLNEKRFGFMADVYFQVEVLVLMKANDVEFVKEYFRIVFGDVIDVVHDGVMFKQSSVLVCWVVVWDFLFEGVVFGVFEHNERL